ncbi:NAD-dependent protein deacetylase [Pseudomonas sp. HR96]|uniref:NAD-dependent protein deacetylase n=1 Tax=Pseudomonas sp. HR96 TaxID=1027966 RepID=UPI002A75559C|nr:NAD-dependent protein deacetylase [Pseudomonas sp. HR96]WPP01811.1 NAD-dependent protein deacetylase [Pseudomonas sp. HR96]
MLDTDTQSSLHALAERLAVGPLLVLTGAGISTGSGIPDYRDTDGVRRGNAPIMHQDFVKSAATRKRYWARAMVGWQAVCKAQPNAAHRALAGLQNRGLVSAVITQNVDGLHDAAGSRKVIELHGNLHRVVCMDCSRQMLRAHVQEVLESENPALQHVHAVLAPDGDAQLAAEFLAGFRMPHCPGCGSDRLKPDVVFFGDGVSAQSASDAWRAVTDSAALLVVGSSLMAYSSFRLCQEMSRQGKPLLAINLGKTRADGLFGIKARVPCEEALPWLAERLA